jgi:dihydroorotate dehydrogenase electron transfer subunit
MNQEIAGIIGNQEVMPGVYLLTFNSSSIAGEAHPGQFVMVGCDSGYGRLLRRPISICQASRTTVSLLFAVVGTGTEWLSRRQVGDNIDILGPVGNGFSILPESKNLLLVAGGMGIAPLLFLAYEAKNRDFTIKLLSGARTANQLCPGKLLPSGLDSIIATEDGTAGLKGLITGLLPDYADWADQVFTCGPAPMYRAIADKYAGYFKNKSIQASLEVRMGCGLGFCYACTIKTLSGLKQVCKDGPVFELSDIIWDEIK